MRFSSFLFSLPLLAYAAPTQKRWEGAEACAYIATQVLNDPHDVVSCLKSFPFREELRQNVMAVAESVINFYTFETSAISSPSPYDDTKVHLRRELERIKTQHYDTDYDFNIDLYFSVNQLNDGHTMWIPDCYVNAFQNLLPIPIVSLAKDVDSHGYITAPSEAIYVIPDANEFFSPFLNGSFHKYYEDKGIDVKRLEGAEITSISGQDPFAYVDRIADEYSGGYIGRDIRQSMAYSSYRFYEGVWGQRLGAFAGPIVPDYPQELEVTVTLIPRDTNVPETITIPYVSAYIGGRPFLDQQSYWAVNCAAQNWTNGIDLKPYMQAANDTATGLTAASSIEGQVETVPKREAFVGALPDLNFLRTAIDLPKPFVPTSPNLTGSNDATYFTLLPNTSVGVMVLGSFYPRDFIGWKQLVIDGIANLKTQGADQLVIDVTNNPGGYVCAQFLVHRLLAGSSVDHTPGFEGVIRANELGRQMMASNIELAKEYNYADDDLLIAYWPSNWNRLSDSAYGPSENFLVPPQNLTINGKEDSFWQRFRDQCNSFLQDIPTAEAPFDFANVLIVGNGQCGSACAQFVTILQELHNVKIANFGAAKRTHSGVIGGIVLEWRVLDTEVKTANMKNNSLAEPDLLVSGNFRHNWRSAYSYRKPDTFLQYADNAADYWFPYTAETWNNPQALWTFAASEIFNIRASDGA